MNSALQIQYRSNMYRREVVLGKGDSRCYPVVSHMDIYPDQPASVTILGLNDGHPGFPARVVVGSGREIVFAVAPLSFSEGFMLKLACGKYVILGRVAAVHKKEDEDHVRLEVRHLLDEADLRLIRQKWF